MRGRVRRESYEKVISDANIVPLVDVCLVLLIIFMITSQYIRYSIQVNIPKAEASEKSVAKNEVIITVTKDNQIFLADSKTPTTKDELTKTLKQKIDESKMELVFLRTDGEVPIREVIEISEIIKKSGGKVSLITNKKQPKNEEKN